jgi:RNA polymerase subunit RPABC4/transcription elongation factor Spt4
MLGCTHHYTHTVCQNWNDYLIILNVDIIVCVG